MNTLALDKLPDVSFAEKSPALIESELISAFEELRNRKLYPGDQMRIFLLAFVKYLALQRSLIDFSGKQNLLKYAGEGFLQNVAALPGKEILEPSAASTTLKFTISIALPNDVIIPKGTRATPGNKLYFATLADAIIPSGELEISVNAECLQTGTIGNGFYPGQINQLSDPFPYNCSVENTDITHGGADREDLDAFRLRIREAPESYSTAGPYGAYMFWAKTASQLITDVSVTSPSPGVVEIVPLLSNGELPTQAILDDVYKECSDDTRRPLTDHVIVRAPEEVNYDISFKYYISRRDSSIGLSIQNKVNEAALNYVLWQRSALGRDLNPSKLVEMLMDTGIKRAEVSKPVFQKALYYQVMTAGSVAPVYGGLEDG